MPKMKTKRSAAKRFRKTAKGKLVRNCAYKSHLLESKTSKRKRRLAKGGLVHKADEARMKKLLPY
jgi:large subunit ribosomal protein L35